MQEFTVDTSDKKQLKAISRVPFLADFPFPDFTFQYHLMKTVSPSTFESIADPVDGIAFAHTVHNDILINVLEKEVWHLHEIRNNIKLVNDITNKVTNAINNPDLLVKRDAVLDAEEWFKAIEGKKFSIGVSTFSDILTSFIGKNKIDEIEIASTLVNELYNRKKILVLTKSQKKVMEKYFQFQLVYYKMLIGIIIAAKISF